MKNITVYLKTILSFLLFIFCISLIGQNQVSYDTIIVYDPETYTETMTVVKNVTNQRGENCYTLMLGSKRMDQHQSGPFKMTQEVLIEEFTNGLSVEARSDCEKAKKLSEYSLVVKNKDGRVTNYDYMQVKDIHSSPAMYQRVFFDPETVTLNNIKIITEKGDQFGLASIIIKVVE